MRMLFTDIEKMSQKFKIIRECFFTLFLTTLSDIKNFFKSHWKEIFIISIPLALFSILVFFTPFFDHLDEKAYLLSAISQGLAALFALVITITFVSAQVLVKYGSHQLDRIFTPLVRGYLIFFIISIIYPLALLLTNCQNIVIVAQILTKLSLILTAICLSLMIPYILHFKELLKPENIIKYHTDKIRGQLEKLRKR